MFPPTTFLSFASLLTHWFENSKIGWKEATERNPPVWLRLSLLIHMFPLFFRREIWRRNFSPSFRFPRQSFEVWNIQPSPQIMTEKCEIRTEISPSYWENGRCLILIRCMCMYACMYADHQGMRAKAGRNVATVRPSTGTVLVYGCGESIHQ